MALKLLQTRVTEAEAAEFAAIAAASNLSGFELLRRAVRGVIEAWHEQTRPRPVVDAPRTDRATLAVPLQERAHVFQAIHALGQQRAALLRQLTGDACELEQTDPTLARTLAATVVALEGARYTWDDAGRRWLLDMPGLPVTVASPGGGWSPDQLMVRETVNAEA